MKQLNVVIGYYPDLFYRNGGLQIQIKNTIKALKFRGHNVMHYYEWIVNPCEIDIYHQFGLEPSTYRIFMENSKLCKKIVVSPIFQTIPNLLKKQIKFINKIPKLNFQGYNFQKTMINRADGFIFLGNNERVELNSFFDCLIRDYVNIPNGIDLHLNNTTFSKDRYILSVGTICKRKNQKVLIEICNELNIPLKLVGPIGEKSYYDECLDVANDQIEFLGELDNKSELFIKTLSEAKLFALVSKSEVLPISVFEALALGVNVVCTEKCSVMDYISDDNIKFCDPNSYNNIKHAIEELYNKDGLVRENFIEEYSWDNVAIKIEQFYIKLLNA